MPDLLYPSRMACKARCTFTATDSSGYAVQNMHSLAGGGGRPTKHSPSPASYNRLTAAREYVYIIWRSWERVSGYAVPCEDLAPHNAILEQVAEKYMHLKGRDRMCTGTHDFIPASETCKLELIYEVTSQRCENVLYLVKSGGWSESDLRNLAEGIEDIYIATLATQQGTAVDLVLVKATDVETEDSFGFEVEPSSLAVGQRNENIQPGNVTVATKFTTGHTGRSFRGRAYWVGLTEPMTVGNTLAGGIGDLITAAWADFFAGIATLMPGATHAVVSYCHNNTWRPNAQVVPVTDYATDFNLDSQRRRLNGRGQ